MRITESKLRRIIRSVIAESSNHESVTISSSDPRFNYITDFIEMGTNHFLEVCEQRGCRSLKEDEALDEALVSEIGEWCYEKLEDTVDYGDPAGVFIPANNDYGEVNMLVYVQEKIGAGVERMLRARAI